MKPEEHLDRAVYEIEEAIAHDDLGSHDRIRVGRVAADARHLAELFREARERNRLEARP